MSNDEAIKNYRFESFSILFLIFFGYMGFYGNHQIADQMAKNPKNIIKSCMYYVRDVKRRQGYVTELNIDGRVYEDFLIHTRKSEPFAPQNYAKFLNYIRENPNICHPIGYVELINLGFYKKIFVYHYYGDFNLKSE